MYRNLDVDQGVSRAEQCLEKIQEQFDKGAFVAALSKKRTGTNKRPVTGTNKRRKKATNQETGPCDGEFDVSDSEGELPADITDASDSGDDGER